MVCGNFILPEPASYVFFYVFSICATYCTLSNHPKQIAFKGLMEEENMGSMIGKNRYEMEFLLFSNQDFLNIHR